MLAPRKAPRKQAKVSKMESELAKSRLRSLPETQSEDEHASENEQEHSVERMRNEGPITIKNEATTAP